MLIRQIERLRRAKCFDELVVATSDQQDDLEIVIICKRSSVKCFRGSLNDVLDRFYHAARQYSPDHIVRLTGDCPVADPEVIDDVIDYYLSGDYDYVSNILEPTFPHGLDVEIFKYSCLKTAWSEAKLPIQREHVTPFIWQNRERFKIGCFKNDINLSKYRWTVDEPEDFRLIQAIYRGLYPNNPEFNMNDILEFVDARPELLEINNHFKRNTIVDGKYINGTTTRN